MGIGAGTCRRPCVSLAVILHRMRFLPMRWAGCAIGLYAVLVAYAQAQTPARTIEVPYRGLNYSVLSKGGVTVMIAPLELSILGYSAAHVWITNGSPCAIQVGPQVFTAKARSPKLPQPAKVIGVPDDLVVREVMKRARFDDVLSLVRAYERNLYGFKNSQAVSYYQKRKQIAMAGGGGRRLRAGATVSTLVLARTEVPPGEFREGTVFFLTGDRETEFLEFFARVAGLSFLLRPRLPPAKDPDSNTPKPRR